MPSLSHPPLGRLTVNNVHLYVRVGDLSLNAGRGRPGFPGRTVAEVRGWFSADSVDNSVADIQACLSSPFNVMASLEYDGAEYDLFITGMKWGVDALQADDDVFGHRLQYRCTFVASPTAGAVAVGASRGNAVVWDVGLQRTADLRDMGELVGGDVFQLAAEAVRLIDKYRRFRASPDCPQPSAAEGAGGADDVAAVLAGQKPAACVDQACLAREPVLSLLLREVAARGMQVEAAEYPAGHCLVAGIPYHVRQLVQLLGQAARDGAGTAYYYQRLYELLGMPRPPADQITPPRDFGFNRT